MDAAIGPHPRRAAAPVTNRLSFTSVVPWRCFSGVRHIGICCGGCRRHRPCFSSVSRRRRRLTPSAWIGRPSSWRQRRSRQRPPACRPDAQPLKAVRRRPTAGIGSSAGAALVPTAAPPGSDDARASEPTPSVSWLSETETNPPIRTTQKIEIMNLSIWFFLILVLRIFVFTHTFL
jgi:hypothetical protein